MAPYCQQLRCRHVKWFSRIGAAERVTTWGVCALSGLAKRNLKKRDSMAPNGFREGGPAGGKSHNGNEFLRWVLAGFAFGHGVTRKTHHTNGMT